MIEPGLELQTAVRAALIADAGVMAHLAPEAVRAGPARPENLPCIVMEPARVSYLGRASGGQLVAEARLILNIWAIADGSTVAEAIAGAVMVALMDAPRATTIGATTIAVDDWERPALVWMRDPDPAQSRTHGAVALRAVVRWRA